MTAKKFTIVLARAEKTKLVPTGRTVTRDRNYFPEFTTELEGKALRWLNAGTDADLVKARLFAAENGYTVFTYPTSERDPLGLARAEVLK